MCSVIKISVGLFNDVFRSSCRGDETSHEFKLVNKIRDFSYRRNDGSILFYKFNCTTR